MTITTGTRIQQATAALLLTVVPVGAYAKPVDQTAPSVPPNGGPAASGMSLQDFQKRHEQKLLAADTDGDGKVSKAEFIATAKPGKRDPAARFAKLDRNGDGLLDKSEIGAMLVQRFKRLDTNGDGLASAQERAAAHTGKANRPESDS